MRRLPEPAKMVGGEGGMDFEREVIDRLARMEQDIKPLGKLVDTVNSSKTAIEVVKKDVADHERRIGGIEGWGKWLAVTVGGLIIYALWVGIVA